VFRSHADAGDEKLWKSGRVKSSEVQEAVNESHFEK
jgi:hypothetical protein